MYWIYALYSERFDKIYVGQTNDITRRLFEHNFSIENSSWTKSYRPWNLIYSEEVSSRIEAMKRERQLKSGGGRRFLRSLLSEVIKNP